MLIVSPDQEKNLNQPFAVQINNKHIVRWSRFDPTYTKASLKVENVPISTGSNYILQSTSLSAIVRTNTIYKTRHFARWARKIGLNDSLLESAVLEIQRGLLEADLGGGIVKKRIAL
ncbi:MAG: type II toxin-antitoxin system RelE/ParE family toxin, partial [Desulfobacterales bacterium]|nr:type II toxin-antitoxin system RelE/ParE family toxin [Desulfobacterales bacterium]